MNFKEIDNELKKEFDLSNVKLETYYNKFDYFSEAVFFYAKRQTATEIGLAIALNCRRLAIRRAAEYLQTPLTRTVESGMTYEEADMSLMWLEDVQKALSDIRKTITIKECEDYTSKNFHFDDSPASAKKKHKEITMFASATLEFLYVKRQMSLGQLEKVIQSEINDSSIRVLLKKISVKFRPTGGANNKKFTDEQVIEIRKKRKNGVPYKELSKQYETHGSTLCQLCSHKTYNHIK